VLPSALQGTNAKILKALCEQVRSMLVTTVVYLSLRHTGTMQVCEGSVPTSA
jgi:hypothetical protein